jgi:hypothetical protein
VDLLVLELDLGTLQIKSYADSKAELYSQAKGKLELTKGKTHQLEKNEKVVVFSAGFLFNWKEGHPGKDLTEFVKANQKLPQGELMSELFFNLKETKSGNFLKRDATAVMMEINRHGIHKV